MAEKKKSGGQPGNKNAVGGKGGDGAPKGNKYAERYGFFSKYLPPDMLEIWQDIQEKSPMEMLWDQIEIQFAAIMRAQKIMMVESAGETVVDVISESEGGTTYRVQHADERYDRYLSAQSRAMGTLNNMLRQYEEMCNREGATEEQRARIDKLRADTARVKAETARVKEGKDTTIVIEMPSEAKDYAN